MRVLHFVERDTDGGPVVLATSDGHEQFELAVDQALREAVTAQQPAAPAAVPARPSREPTITPREIQMRVRAGEAPEALAEAHGAGLDWVQRFAGPVLAERVRMADEARRAKARRSTTDGQSVIFGEAVDERFAAHGIDPSTVRWDAHRREDAQWVVTAHWIGGQSERDAQWTFHLSARSVAPIDDAAADLLSDSPIRPVAAPEPDGPPNLTLAPPLAPGLVAFPPMPDAHTGPLPRDEQLFDQTKFDGGDELEPEPEPVAELEPGTFDEPHLPLSVPDAPEAPAVTARIPRLTNLGVAPRTETEDEKAARASIPSWDDILLGVRRKHD